MADDFFSKAKAAVSISKLLGTHVVIVMAVKQSSHSNAKFQ